MFVFQSVWQDKSGYYYVFGYLAAVSVILVITVVEVTVVATYLQLCAEVSRAPLLPPPPPPIFSIQLEIKLIMMTEL